MVPLGSALHERRDVQGAGVPPRRYGAGVAKADGRGLASEASFCAGTPDGLPRRAFARTAADSTVLASHANFPLHAEPQHAPTVAVAALMKRSLQISIYTHKGDAQPGQLVDVHR